LGHAPPIAFGFPAFAVVLAIFWLIIARPDLGARDLILVVPVFGFGALRT
jgi:hypothetical protein